MMKLQSTRFELLSGRVCRVLWVVNHIAVTLTGVWNEKWTRERKHHTQATSSSSSSSEERDGYCDGGLQQRRRSVNIDRCGGWARGVAQTCACKLSNARAHLIMNTARVSLSRRLAALFRCTVAPLGGKGELAPLWVDVQKLRIMCVLSLSWNFFVSRDKYIARPSSKEPR